MKHVLDAVYAVSAKEFQSLVIIEISVVKFNDRIDTVSGFGIILYIYNYMQDDNRTK
jgi:hypothetical protein